MLLATTFRIWVSWEVINTSNVEPTMKRKLSFDSFYYYPIHTIIPIGITVSDMYLFFHFHIVRGICYWYYYIGTYLVMKGIFLQDSKQIWIKLLELFYCQRESSRNCTTKGVGATIVPYFFCFAFSNSFRETFSYLFISVHFRLVIESILLFLLLPKPRHRLFLRAWNVSMFSRTCKNVISFIPIELNWRVVKALKAFRNVLQRTFFLFLSHFFRMMYEEFFENITCYLRNWNSYRTYYVHALYSRYVEDVVEVLA